MSCLTFYDIMGPDSQVGQGHWQRKQRNPVPKDSPNLVSPNLNSPRSFRLHELVSWCFEPGQPQRVTSGLKTDFRLYSSYSLNKLYNVRHKKLNKSFKRLHTNITLTHFIFCKNTPISRKKSKIISGITFRKSEYKDFSSKYFFLISNKSAHSIKMCLTVITALHATQTGASSFLEIILVS